MQCKKKVNIFNFNICLIALIFFMSMCFTVSVKADTLTKFSAYRNSEKNQFVKLEEWEDIYVLDAAIGNDLANFSLGGEIDKNAEITKITSSYDPWNVYKTNITYTESEESRNYKISYTLSMNPGQMIPMKAKSIGVYGAIHFTVTVRQKDGSERDIILIQNVKSGTLQDKNKGGVQYVAVNDVEKEETLEGESLKSTFGNNENKYHITSVDKDVKEISLSLMRTMQDKATFTGTADIKTLGWLTFGENYVGYNNGLVRFNALNEIYAGKYTTPTYSLKKGYNVIDLYIAYGSPVINMTKTKPYANIFDSIEFPMITQKSVINSKYMLSRNLTCIPYIIYWDGETSDVQTVKSSNCELSEVRAYAGMIKKGDYPTEYKVYSSDTGYRMIVPAGTENKNIYLGVLTKDSLASVNVLGNEKSEGGSLQDGCDRCGFYYGVNLADESIETNEAGNKVIKVQVTAEDGTEKTYKIEVEESSSECDLKNVAIDNASVANLDTQLNAGETSFYLDVENSDKKIDFSSFEVSAGATVTVDGQKVEAGQTVSVTADAITRVVVTALDGTTNKEYLFIHRFNGKDMPYFTISDQTKAEAKELLDAGWSKRSAEEQKKLLYDYWGVYKACATNSDLTGAVVYDVTTHTFKQATDYGAVIMELVMIGENPYSYTDDKGNNLVQALINKPEGPFASYIWALWGLKAAGAEIPQKLVDEVVKQAASKTFTLDMKGWALAAVADLVEPTELAKLVESFRDSLVTEGDDAGMFFNKEYKLPNTISHGCVLEGMAAAGVDVEKVFGVSDTGTPLQVIKNRYLTADGKFKYNISSQDEPSFSKDLIIGLGDIVNGGNVWTNCKLTKDKYSALLEVGQSMISTMGITADTEDEQLKAVYTTYQTAKGAYDGASSVYGIGKQYYDLYEAIAKVSPEAVNKPDVRMLRSMDDNAAIDAVNADIAIVENIENVFDNAEAVIKVKKAYDALGEGQDEAYQERMRGYVTKADVLQDAYEKLQTVLPVIEAIDNLPETATTEAEAAIEAAREAYVALSDAEKAGVYNYSKLADLLAQLAQLKDKATAVSEQINALPAAEQVTLENEAAIAAARAAYDALSDAEKAAVTNYDKLQAAEQQIGNIKAAAEVTQMIDAIGEITLDNYETKYEQIVTARSAYDNLAESAKALVTNLDTLKKAEETYQSMDEDVKEVIAAINQLKDPLSKSSADMDANALYEIWDEYTYIVVNTRGLADELTKDKQAIVTNMKDLETAEAYIQIIKKDSNYEQAKMLLGAEDFPKAGDYDENNIADVAKRVAQAKAVVDKLTDEQKTALDEELGTGTVENLKTLAELAKAVEGYDDQYKTTQDELDEAAASQYVKELTEVYDTYKDKEVSRSDIAIIRQTIKAYDNLTDAQKDIIKNAEDASTITAMLDALKKQDEQVQKDEKAAAEVTEYIKNLPTSLNLDNMEAVRSDLQMIADKYNALNANAQHYVRMLSKVTATNNVLNTMTAEINTFRQGKPAVTAAATAYNSVTVSWNTYQYAQSYDVYRKTAGGEWTKLGNTTALQYVDQTVAGSTAYSYTIVALSSRWGQSVSSAYDENGAAVTTPAAPQPDNGNTTPDNGNTTPDNNNTPAVKDYTSLNATSAGVSSIKLSWKKVSKASGYVVYRANSANGKYKAIKTIKKGKTTSFTDKKRTTGKTYYYKLRPYKTVKNKKQYMDYSSVVSTKAVPGRVKFTKLTAGNQKATLKWKKVSGASGYLLYRSDRRDGGFTCINSVSSRKTNYTNTKLKKGQTYYYRIRAYRKVGGKRVYGNFSVVKAVKAK